MKKRILHLLFLSFEKHTPFFFSFFLGFLFLFGSLLFQYLQLPSLQNKNGIITFLDGRGESIVFTFSTGHTVIIDGGILTETEEKLSKILPFWNRHIDILLLTHSDRDHLEGFISLLRQYSIGKIYISGRHHNSEVFSRFLSLIRKHHIPLIFANTRTDIQIGENIFDIFFPEKSILGEKTGSNNNGSLIARLVTSSGSSEKSFLFTGDIEKHTEKKILFSSAKLTSDVLKIAHHGSKTSSTPDFLHAVSPKKVIIIAHKNNPFSHPHPSTITSLINLSSLLYSPFITKEKGDISLSF